MKNKIESGISLIEILIVVTIFAVLGILITRSIILTLQGSKKSEGIVAVRENLDYAMGIIERQIRNANSITNCLDASSSIIYLDQNNKTTSFSCTGDSVASGSATLIDSSVVTVTGCSFVCKQSETSTPDYVDIFLEAESATLSGPQNSRVTINNRIYLRNY